ncbi:MAG: hypothetical protein ACREVO_04095 [Steroidobacteraceae bacterium]
MRLKVIRGAAGLSVLLSGFASALALCCSVPWVVALVGVSGAILFARVGEIRPYFIGAAAGQLWNGARPPLPEFWMEQLGGLPKGRYLNARVFARQVARQLARGQPAAASRKTGT